MYHKDPDNTNSRPDTATFILPEADTAISTTSERRT